MKIGIITTIDTNIGDDLIREGLLHVLSRLRDDFSFILINKHNPSSMYPRSHPLNLPMPFSGRLGRYYTRAIDSVLYGFGHSAFDSCDAIIQAGAPVYFHDCSKTEWSKMIWEHVVCRLASRMPVMNLAAGSCYPWERIPNSIPSEKDEQFIRKITKASSVTSVRDELSQRLLRLLGFDVPLVPCSAFLAALKYSLSKAPEPRYVFFNYMLRGSHYDFNQRIDASAWEQEMKNLVIAMKKRHPVAFICHNRVEYELAGMIDGSIPRFLPKTPAEYFQIASKGIAGVFNRMHASVAFAGLGIPSIGVGADTRMLMPEKLGLKTVYVKMADAKTLEGLLESLITNRLDERQRLLTMQSNVLIKYEQLVRGILDGAD